MEILEHTLNWSHIAPTAPDTLGKIKIVSLSTTLSEVLIVCDGFNMI